MARTKEGVAVKKRVYDFPKNPKLKKKSKSLNTYHADEAHANEAHANEVHAQ
jgi:hypothetical protein